MFKVKHVLTSTFAAKARSSRSHFHWKYIDFDRDKVDRTNVYLTVTVKNHAHQPIFFLEKRFKLTQLETFFKSSNNPTLEFAMIFFC